MKTLAKSRKLIEVLFCVSILLLAGCGNKSESPPVISIQSASPSGDEALLAGDQVTFTVEVRANGLPQIAEVSLVIQSANGEPIVATDMVSLTNDKVVKLTATASIPDTTTIRLFTPVYLTGQDQTASLDTRVYKVVGRREK